MFQPDEDGIYARVPVAPARRGLGLVVLYGLGALLIYLIFDSFAGVGAAAIMLVMACACFWAAERMRAAAGVEVLLTADQIVTSTGLVLADLDNVLGVNRGALSVKPSTGFTLMTKTPQPRSWCPGVWWRFGRRVGIGGITGAGAAKFMAEQIALHVAERDSAN